MKNGGYIIRLRLVVFEILGILGLYWTFGFENLKPGTGLLETRCFWSLPGFLFRFLSAIFGCPASFRPVSYTHFRAQRNPEQLLFRPPP